MTKCIKRAIKVGILSSLSFRIFGIINNAEIVRFAMAAGIISLMEQKYLRENNVYI